MADVLKRLSGPTALTTGAVTQYTVPTATTATVRNIHVANETATAATFTMSIGTDGAGKRLFKDVDIPGKGFLSWSGNIPLAAAEVIQALAGTGTALTLVISGVETT
jgi:hypothetical protein